MLSFQIHNASAFQQLSPQEEAALLNAARLLQAASLRAAPLPRLKGKNLGMLCGDGEATREGRALFERAAAELGAQVATIRPAFSNPGHPDEIAHAARMLGRFYDAVECLGLPPETVRQIGRHAGIPVYDGAAEASHPIARLADRLDDRTSPSDNRRFVLQALLLGSIA
ncbi:ornithine carbamoyltransferase [Variovorax sp. TBS-050B]|uniref:ornithine carbamoyltransferase n=1 Tax=Variovorax sp. TBS-050B TaxID=2940551 RepID=UPI002473928C|nr:ornithine carbamoyltransferase [Variovorax sp. TBS-050B]MDH6594378.1 ornithine carbamoyltransferase [Variovorax sp. TBS-050B]